MICHELTWIWHGLLITFVLKSSNPLTRPDTENPLLYVYWHAGTRGDTVHENNNLFRVLLFFPRWPTCIPHLTRMASRIGKTLRETGTEAWNQKQFASSSTATVNILVSISAPAQIRRQSLPNRNLTSLIRRHACSSLGQVELAKIPKLESGLSTGDQPEIVGLETGCCVKGMTLKDVTWYVLNPDSVGVKMHIP